MWSDFSIALSVPAFLLSLFAALLSARTANRVQALRAMLEFLSASRTESTSHSTDEVARSKLNELADTVELLANKVKMQRVRNAATHADRASRAGEMPDPYKDPDGWRAAMNAKLKLGNNF